MFPLEPGGVLALGGRDALDVEPYPLDLGRSPEAVTDGHRFGAAQVHADTVQRCSVGNKSSFPGMSPHATPGAA